MPSHDPQALVFRLAAGADAPLLATLNLQLIRDEGHRKAMDLSQLTERMEDWLRGEYAGVVFERDFQVLGYALYRREPEHVYLRQLFVVPAARRQGVGRSAIKWLWDNAWRGSQRVRLDVLVGNARARAFWRSVGFDEYCMTLEATAPP